MPTPRLTGVLLIFLVFYLVPTHLALADAKSKHHAQGGKLQVSLQASAPQRKAGLVAGEDIKLAFSVRDRKAKQGVPDLNPAGWLAKRSENAPAMNQASCEAKAKTLVRKGLFTSEADVEFNGFSVITLNSDNSVGILNPQVKLKSSSLAGLIPFKGKASAWAFNSNSGMAYIASAEAGHVAVIDIVNRQVAKYLTVGQRPSAIALQPHTGRLWIGDETGGVFAVDGATQQVVKQFALRAGPVDFAFDADGKYAFVAAPAEQQVLVIDAQTLAVRHTVKVLADRLAFSAQEMALYAADSQTGKGVRVDIGSGKASADFTLLGAISAFALSPDGRFLLSLHTQQQQLTVYDTARQRVLHTVTTERNPEQIRFSKEIAYIYHRDSTQLGTLPLSLLGDKPVAPTHIPTGAQSADAFPPTPSLSRVAILPDGHGALVANPAEKLLYYYMEGMMVPMETYKTQTAPPLGLFVYDRGLRDGPQPGTYQVHVRVEDAGRYDVIFFNRHPRLTACFDLAVTADPAHAAKPSERVLPVAYNLFNKQVFAPQAASKLEFELHDGKTGAPLADLRDVRVLSFRLGSNWQYRGLAAPRGQGGYEVDIVFPEPGQYHLLVETNTLGVSFGDIPHSFVQVNNPDRQ